MLRLLLDLQLAGIVGFFSRREVLCSLPSCRRIINFLCILAEDCGCGKAGLHLAPFFFAAAQISHLRAVDKDSHMDMPAFLEEVDIHFFLTFLRIILKVSYLGADRTLVGPACVEETFG